MSVETEDMARHDESGYNGWKNYATWGVALVLDNDQGTYSRCRAYAEAFVNEAQAPDPPKQVADGIWSEEQYVEFSLEDFLKDYVEELCGLEADGDDSAPTLMARQVISAGLAEVDWREIAQNQLSDLEIDPPLAEVLTR
jgi:hypothetical protein